MEILYAGLQSVPLVDVVFLKLDGSPVDVALSSVSLVFNGKNSILSFAREMELPEHEIEGIYLAASIHDVGKIAIPAEILSKPGKLSDIEFMLVKTHAQAGYDLIRGLDFPWELATMVYQHHERMDGSGYPQGLKGPDILLGARIMAVADSVETMATHRPCRAGLGIDFALAEITRNKGKLYDPDVVDICLRLFREKGFKLEDN
jgi:HD-GYP domain-containing protein (c-di-GMP phosphodiesterase class II)